MDKVIEQVKKEIFDKCVVEAGGNLDIATAGVLVGQFGVMNSAVKQALRSGGPIKGAGIGLASLDNIGTIFAATTAKLCEVMHLDVSEVTRIATIAANATMEGAAMAMAKTREAKAAGEAMSEKGDGNATVH